MKTFTAVLHLKQTNKKTQVTVIKPKPLPSREKEKANAWNLNEMLKRVHTQSGEH